MNLKDLAAEKILVLDGAMGTMIQRHKFTESDYRGAAFKDHPLDQKGNNDLLSITQPEAIRNIHLQYLEAGADIIETNTFNSNRISMVDYGLEASPYIEQLNKESVRIAKEAIELYHEKHGEKTLFVAGSLGPTNKTTSMSPRVNEPEYREVDFDEMAEVYFEQSKALLEAGADILLVETIFDTLNAKAAFFGIEQAFDEINQRVPLMASGTITDKSGRTLSGQTTEAFLISLSHVDLFSIGLNCSLGAKDLKPYLKILSDRSISHISVYPNAGLPNAFGGYDETPEFMAEQVQSFMDDALVNVVGGCCGTSPDHIRAISQLCNQYSPRKLAQYV